MISMFGYNSPSSDESLGGWDDLELFTSSDFEDDDSNSDTVVLPSYSHSLSSRKSLWLARVVAQTRASPVKPASERKKIPAKHSRSGCGSKVSRKEVETELKLICFPEIDKRDSLTYFPYIFVKLLNNGDQKSLKKFMLSYLDRSCVISLDSLGTYQQLSCQQMLEMYAVTNEIHPDSVSCVHTTRLLENAIEAMIYYKYTDSVALSQSIAKTSSDPFVQRIAANSRGDGLVKRMNLEDKSQQEREQMTLLAQSDDDDLTIYGKMTLRVTFDVYSKKVIRFETVSDVISSVKKCSAQIYEAIDCQSSTDLTKL